MRRIGVYAIGTYLPPIVRTNEWWSPEILARWREKRLAKMMDGRRELRDPDTEGTRMVLEAMARQGDDPFLGGRERRVFPDDMSTASGEVEAARVALDRAGLEAGAIDALIEYCNAPDVCAVTNAAAVHRALDMSPRCLTFSLDAACNGFLVQLSVAEGLVASGAARTVMLVACNALSRFCPPDEPFSPWFGDGVSAVIVGPVREGHGLLATVHRTESALYLAVGAGTRGRWHAGERIKLHSEDAAASRAVMTGAADRAREVVGEALRTAGVSAEQVSYYGNHPASVWFADVTRRAAGISHAKTVDTFAWTGNLGAANIPLSLALGVEQGLLRDGDFVAACGGGAGMTYSGAVLRWGGR